MSLDLREPLFNDDRSLLSDDLDSIGFQSFSCLCVKNDQTWEPPHLKVLRRRLHTSIFERQSEPGHLRKVLIVEILVLIAREKYDFHLFLILVCLVVQLDE